MPVFSEAHVLEGEKNSEFAREFGEHNYSLIRNNYKLIYSSNQSYGLYDLSTDPSETNNLMEEYSAGDAEIPLPQMKAEVASWLDRLNARKLTPVELSQEELDKTRSRLRALGYIQ